MATPNNEKALAWFVTGVTLDVRAGRVALLAHNVCTSILRKRLHKHAHTTSNRRPDISRGCGGGPHRR